MSTYRINLGSTWEYKVQALNTQQENKELFESILRPGDVLPCCVSTLPILWLHKYQGNVIGKFKYLQVRRGRIKEWLEFLIKNNPLYTEYTMDKIP